MMSCQICGKRLKYLNNFHLAMHGISPKEYKIKFGEFMPEYLKKLGRERFKRWIIRYNKSMAGKSYDDRYGKAKALVIRRQISKTMTGYVFSKSRNTKISITRKKLFKFGVLSQKGRFNNMFGKRQSKKTIELILKNVHRRPNSLESSFIEIFNSANLNYRYVGDGSLILGNPPINPDFVHLKRKIVVEVFSAYYKLLNYGSVSEYIRSRSKLYRTIGFSCIFICQISKTHFNVSNNIVLSKFANDERKSIASLIRR